MWKIKVFLQSVGCTMDIEYEFDSCEDFFDTTKLGIP